MHISQPAIIIPDRNQALNEISAAGMLWDIIVIGGGATGLGTALDAAARGYKVLLLEQCDFAKGTSGKSTKLIHGGVRYLAQGNFKLVTGSQYRKGYYYAKMQHTW
jgi:glycerol-3-phosphate dehydrogenase